MGAELMRSVMGRLVAFLVALLVGSVAVRADEAALAGWQDWLRAGHPELACPWEAPRGHRCVWPGRLRLDLAAGGGRFDFDLQVLGETALVALPGDRQHWPQQVQIGGQPAPLVERDGRPFLALPPGQYRVEGRWRWSRLPGRLSLPSDIALVTLYRDGQLQAADRRGEQLVLSGGPAAAPAAGRDSLQLEVYRKLADGVPVRLRTRLQLAVSGSPRELTLGPVLPAGVELLDLQAPLPARLEADGRLRLQVRPGVHVVEIEARFGSDPQVLAGLLPTDPLWPSQEYLSVDSESGLRQWQISGAAPVDTGQIALPPAWAQLPTYRIGADTRLQLATETRGQQAPPANELNVSRDLWLDFDGAGLTALDRIHGHMQRDWRLQAAPDTRIGRASVDGEAVLITEHEGRPGIEIRSPSINLEAITRHDSVTDFAASGWDARAQSFSARLHLPPGWRVLHAGGVDQVSGSWLNRWDLWDVFLWLIVVAATRKLLGNGSAALAAAAMLVALQEPMSPLLILPLLLIIIALLPLAARWVRSTLVSCGVLLSAAFVLVFIGFAVDAFRLAIYPSLERAAVGNYRQSPVVDTAGAMIKSRADLALEQMAPQRQLKSQAPAADRYRSGGRELYQLGDDDRVQTGPGRPAWIWKSVRLGSSGPVAAGERIQVLYSPPWLTSLWRVAMVVLVGLYGGLVLRRLGQLLRPRATPGAAPAAVLGLLLLACLDPLPQARADSAYPPEYLLRELEQRLTRPPTCLPACASFSNGVLRLHGDELQLAFDAYVDTALALPLPARGTNLQLLAVRSDGLTPPLVRGEDGTLLAALERGPQRLQLLARIGGEQASLDFPLPIHGLSLDAPGWQVGGLQDGRLLGDSLTLRRLQQATRVERDTLKPDPAPVFVTVHRHFELHKQWRLHTRVTRVAPATGPFTLTLPLLDGEQPLSDVGEVRDGQLQLQFGHNQNSIAWRASLAPRAQIRLQAAQVDDYVESWQFTPSSRWRLHYDGLAPVRQDGPSLTPLFKPWPGESLQVQVARPEGIRGPTRTLERVKLDFKPGRREQRSHLAIDLRASLGEEFGLRLPADSEVLRLTYAGQSLNLPEGPLINVPLRPGEHSLEVEFQQPRRAALVARTPTIDLDDPASNLHLEYRLPRDRWPLYLSGPAIGPAMLYWGVLCVIVLGALVLHLLARRLQLQLPLGLGGWILLGLGLSTVNSYGVLVAALFFFALAARRQWLDPFAWQRPNFHMLQLGLVVLALVAAFSIVSAIPLGLLASPDMIVLGNGSGSHLFRYYQDASATGDFPRVTVVSVPLWAYRVVMLAWSLWLATRLVSWARWGWQCYSAGAAWRKPAEKNDGESSA